MKRRGKVAISLGAIAVVLALSGYLFMNYLTDRFLQAMVPSVENVMNPDERRPVLKKGIDDSSVQKSTNIEMLTVGQVEEVFQIELSASEDMDVPSKIEDNTKNVDKPNSDGLTVEEKKEAKKIILKKLSEKKYNQLIQIAAKYGLSQGKNYQDSLVEQDLEGK